MFCEHGVIGVALSDGAGSEAYSHLGSAYTISFAGSYFAARFEELFSGIDGTFDDGLKADLITSLLEGLLAQSLEWKELVGKEAMNESVDSETNDDVDSHNLLRVRLKSLAATLLVVAVKDGRYVCAHLGDGVIGAEVCARDGSRAMRLLSQPDNGEFANSTVFVTSESAPERLRLYSGYLTDDDERITGFILMSDGPESVLYEKHQRWLAPACLKLFDEFRHVTVEEFELSLQSTLEKVIQTKTDDDCSIALLATVTPERLSTE